jgi:hypothetical protein
MEQARERNSTGQNGVDASALRRRGSLTHPSHWTGGSGVRRDGSSTSTRIRVAEPECEMKGTGRVSAMLAALPFCTLGSPQAGRRMVRATPRPGPESLKPSPQPRSLIALAPQPAGGSVASRGRGVAGSLWDLSIAPLRSPRNGPQVHVAPSRQPARPGRWETPSRPPPSAPYSSCQRKPAADCERRPGPRRGLRRWVQSSAPRHGIIRGALLGPDVMDLRIHVEIPHLGNMYDGSAPGLAPEVREMRAASRGHALSLHSTMVHGTIPHPMHTCPRQYV